MNLCLVLQEAPVFDDMPEPQDYTQSIDEQCHITMCLAGAIDQNSGGNQHLLQICDRPELKGVLEDCDDGICYSAFDSFFPISLYKNSVYPTFFNALDRNQDGLVNEDDERCQITVIGFSWGGVNAIRLANDITKDSRISPSRKQIDLLITLDPYQPGKANKMKVPISVKKYVEFRRSLAPEEDCSNDAFLGPYIGFKPKCRFGADCTDFDYSISDSIFDIGPNWQGKQLLGRRDWTLPRCSSITRNGYFND